MPPSSTSTDPRAAIQDLLQGNTTWPYATPDIAYADQVTHKAKENRRDPAIYVATDGDDSIERFSADGDSFTSTATVGCDIWILDVEGAEPEDAVREYRDRVVNFINNNYSNDNFANTEFHSIEAVGSSDFRQEHVARQTDHYIYTVEIATERLGQTV